MAFVGFAAMAPIAASAMLDSNRWRPVFYADTPRTLSRYQAFVAEKKDARKAVLFLMGVVNLHKVAKDMSLFSSVFVFDDLQNLHRLTEVVKTFEIADIEQNNGINVPRHLTPAELAAVVSQSGAPPSPPPLLGKVTAALSRRPPSVLESTSRMPPLEEVPESGAQRLLTEIKRILETEESPLPFAVVVDMYSKYLFRMLPRSKITSGVTKLLPDEAKELWGIALDLANSDVGHRMALAFRALCQATDPDYRTGHAVSEFGLKPYSGDFVYFTAVMPPNRSFEFTKEIDAGDKSSLGPQPKFVPPSPAPETKKKRRKKA